MAESLKDLPSVLVSFRLGRVPTLSVCGLRPVSGALLWPRLCVPCTPRSAVPELPERRCWELLPTIGRRKKVIKIKIWLSGLEQVVFGSHAVGQARH